MFKNGIIQILNRVQLIQVSQCIFLYILLLQLEASFHVINVNECLFKSVRESESNRKHAVKLPKNPFWSAKQTSEEVESKLRAKKRLK